MKRTIHFYSQKEGFKLKAQKDIRPWLEAVAQAHGGSVAGLDYIFVSDDELLEMNEKFLAHDTYTDIITFPSDESTLATLMGEIYISVDRVKENAKEYTVTFETELRRVMAHGLLHLVGFKDKSAKDIKAMRAAEDAALVLYTA